MMNGLERNKNLDVTKRKWKHNKIPKTSKTWDTLKVNLRGRLIALDLLKIRKSTNKLPGSYVWMLVPVDGTFGEGLGGMVLLEEVWWYWRKRVIKVSFEVFKAVPFCFVIMSKHVSSWILLQWHVTSVCLLPCPSPRGAWILALWSHNPQQIFSFMSCLGLGVSSQQ